jgi:hypothetical protein
MTGQTPLWHPQEIIGKHWREGQSPEQERILSLARDALDFVATTGQQYPFEDFRKGLPPGMSPRSAKALEAHQLAGLVEHMDRTEAFFTRVRDETGPAEESALIQVILDTLRFISATHQEGAFSDYLAHVEAGAAPYAVASFDTMAEAETWLESHSNPPCFANVLVANAYHTVIHDRESNLRRLPPNESINFHLADLQEQERPEPVASFATREEAEAWFRAQRSPARRAWLSIAGGLFLAAYYPNLHHRALFPLSMAEGYGEDPASTPP